MVAVLDIIEIAHISLLEIEQVATACFATSAPSCSSTGCKPPSTNCRATIAGRHWRVPRCATTLPSAPCTGSTGIADGTPVRPKAVNRHAVGTQKPARSTTACRYSSETAGTIVWDLAMLSAALREIPQPFARRQGVDGKRQKQQRGLSLFCADRIPQAENDEPQPQVETVSGCGSRIANLRCFRWYRFPPHQILVSSDRSAGVRPFTTAVSSYVNDFIER